MNLKTWEELKQRINDMIETDEPGSESQRAWHVVLMTMNEIEKEGEEV
jgi:hypothetical protein